VASTPVQSALARIPPYAKAGIGLGLALLVVGVYWFVFYSDVSAKIEGALQQKRALIADMAQQQQALAGYFADRDELALREQRARELNKVLPAASEEDAFLSAIQQAANSAGIDLKGFAPQDEVVQSFYAKVPMKLDATGRFHQIAKFAYELGKMDRIINVENIELTDPKIAGDEVILKAKVLATAFHAKVSKDARGGAPGAASATPAPSSSQAGPAAPPSGQPAAGSAR
jgi:type IV pilus assembly protein PilO